MFRIDKPLVAACAVAALALSGCSSVEEQSAAEAGSAAQATSAEAKAAQQVVEEATKAVESFEAPGDAVDGVDQLAGKTVYFVPATYQVPVFQAVASALENALGAADVQVEVCDGKANPANMASCIQQGIDAEAAAIITGSIPTDLASVAFESAQKAGIPVVNTMTAPAGPGDPAQYAYLTPDYVALQSRSASWVIADSDAAANVLYIQVTDTPATTIWAEQGALATYERDCPDCEVTVIKANTGQLDKLPSLVTSELTKNPDIDYVQTEVDFLVQPTIDGLQTANATSVKIASMDGTLAALQQLEGGQLVSSEVGFNADALAWYAADQAVRMMAGQPSNTEVAFPYQRMFTAENIDDLDLTPEAEKTGAWYGSTDYQDGFLELWGLAG
ncbi:ribose transport system substrate-binding protein [Mumia flava]|uniref:Ribose transport system substrate-binding protein n=1 Tax=Mumia flava TaxID=1348852 RepID=A0A0B2BH12_9ACTN|nr:substrate-binding domain-containing protein [Mumia flava]PJJ54298.1 ribose transport system substrate-binding protein [Mumia flava]